MKHKKIIVLCGILVLAALLTYVAATHFGSGPCGENATWRVVGHTMTISGTGPMYDKNNDDEELEYRHQINRVVNHVKTIVIEDGITTIGVHLFAHFPNLSTVVIPESVTSIGHMAFYYSKNLTNVTIPDSVTTIDGGAFAATGLTSVTIPGSVTFIDEAFGHCDNLTGIWVAAENQNYCNDEKGVLYDKAMTTLLQYPAGLEGTFEVSDCVTSIGSMAFWGCNRLNSVIIPHGVTTICNRAFFDCQNLTNVTIPDSVTSIGDGVFSGCTSLTNLTIPDSVTTIGDDAFWDCNNLTNVTIPDSVTAIGKDAFAWCTSLYEITFEGDAPVFDGDCFYAVEATVYYPSNGLGWQEVIQNQSHSGITWVAY